MNEIKDRLTQLWKVLETKQLGNMFKLYMKDQGYRKYNPNRKDNTDVYKIYYNGNNTKSNKVQCYYHKESIFYGDSELGIVLRKNAGNYLIIEKKDVRAFEVDNRGVIHYDEILLNKIIEDHKDLFNELFKLI